jgi:uncharacterized protein (TIGR02118 family)
MAKIFVQYKQPADAEAFQRHYFGTHAPLAKALPGLRSYEVSDGAVHGAGGVSGIYLVAMLGFDSVAAINAALESVAGKAALADLPNFAGAGADILICESRAM